MLDFLQALKRCINDEYGEEEERRAAICADCPLKEKRFYADILNAKMENINGYVCTACGCPIATKVFALEKEHICDKWIQ